MLRANVLLFASCLLFASDPRQDPPPEREPRAVLSKGARIANKKLLKEMQGAWRLVDLQLADQGVSGMESKRLDHVGYCLVSGGYLSIEFHIRLLGKGDADQGRSFVTGLHRFDLEEDEGWMETSTIIGTKIDRSGDPRFEPTDTLRRYHVTVEGGAMTLRREDGHTLVFERLADDRTRYDIFGNPLTEEEQAAEEKAADEKKDDEEKDERDEDGCFSTG